MEQERLHLLDSETLAKIAKLELRARSTVEGFVSGLHKSPYQGFSVEFAEHREYVPGDDIRHIDWKVYGRTDRFYIKEYEEETNLIVYLVVDLSRSMAYGRKVSKHEYASILAASLAYLTMKQQDSASLATFSDSLLHYIPPTSNLSQLRYFCQALLQQTDTPKTNIGTVLHRLAEKVKRRGIFILISDMWDDLENILSGIRHIRHKKHDMILFHIIDPDEWEFPFEDLTQFVGLEGEEEILVHPRSIREDYRREVENFCTALKAGCMRNQIDYVPFHTCEEVGKVLSSYLASRIQRI